MAKRENFTADRIAAFKCAPDKQQCIFWDGKAPGLGLRVTAAGAKSYVFETRLNGRSLRITIGSPRTWQLSKAQAEATRLKALTDQGIDPRLQKADQLAENERRHKEAIRKDLTFAKAWRAYIEARRHRWSARHLADHENISRTGSNEKVSGALSGLMPCKLAEVDASKVKAWLRNEAANRPTQAALAFRLLRAFLNWCADMPEYCGIAAADACQTRTAKDTLPKRNSKTDCLQKEQLSAWFAAVRAINNPIISAYLQTLMIIGSRREELAGLKWEDVDFRWQSITIRDKVDGMRTIPLTPYVSSLLSGLPRRNEWVFSSVTAKTGRLQEPSIQHRKVCAIAGIDGLTLHGLRRSFSTLTEWVECPSGVVAQIMGHKPSATAEKHYKVRPLDLLRMWHTKIEAWILEQAGVEFVPAQPGLKIVSSA